MMKYGLIFVTGLFLINSAVHSDERDDTSIFVIEGGIHAGGDTLATVYAGSDTDSIEAGSGASLAFGVRLNITEEMEAVITYGIKLDSITATDLELTFVRYPLNALVLLKSGDWHYGAGLTYHSGVEYERVSDFYGNAVVPFKDAIGFIADFRWFFSEGGYVGGRYTSIDYEVESTGQTFDGSSVGVVVGVYL